MTIEPLNSSTVYKQFVIDWLCLRMATEHEKKKPTWTSKLIWLVHKHNNLLVMNFIDCYKIE